MKRAQRVISSTGTDLGTCRITVTIDRKKEETLEAFNLRSKLERERYFALLGYLLGVCSPSHLVSVSELALRHKAGGSFEVSLTFHRDNVSETMRTSHNNDVWDCINHVHTDYEGELGRGVQNYMPF